MHVTEHLIESHIREYEARLKHIDELIEKIQSGVSKNSDEGEELISIKKDRKKMGDYVEELKYTSPQHFMETAGPMVMWEIVAQRLEHLIEKIKKG